MTQTDQFTPPAKIPARLIDDQLTLHVNNHVAPLLPGLGSPATFEQGGYRFATVDYTNDVVGYINAHTNAGMKGPAYYWQGYTGRFQPREQQRQTIDFFTQHKRAYCFNGLGSGKSAAAIWAAEYLRHVGQVRRVLILCTLSCVEQVWRTELMNLCPMRSNVIVRGSHAKRKQLIESLPDYTIINHDGVKSTFDPLLAADYDLIIDDEGSVHRNASSALSKKTAELSAGRRFWLMTATPTPRGPMDAYGLAKLVTPERLPKSKFHFQQQVEMKVSQYTYVPRPGSEDIVFRTLQPAIRIKTEDCVDLPPVINITRDVPLTKEQAGARKSLIDDFVYQYSQTNDPVNAVTAGDVINKVLQVCQGTIKTGADTYAELDYGPRYTEAKSLIDDAEAKVIIFASYRATCQRLLADINKDYGDGYAEMVIGGVSQTARKQAFDRFKSDPRCKVLVAHPKTAGHGLNLIEANVTIWFGIKSDAELYEQACARMVRPGQTRTMVLAHLIGSPEERKIVQTLTQRMDMQNTVMDMVADYLNG